jgi:hypothetical protein
MPLRVKFGVLELELGEAKWSLRRRAENNGKLVFQRYRNTDSKEMVERKRDNYRK